MRKNQHTHKENFKMVMITLIMVLCMLIIVSISACGYNKPEKSSTEISTEPPKQDTQQFINSYRYPDILPGITTRDQVITKLGNPEQISLDSERNMEVLLYASDNELIPDAIYLQDNLVQFISAKVNEENPFDISTIINLLGNPALITFSRYAEGTRMYIYPDMGRCFLVKEETGVVLFEQTFNSSTLDEYLNLWGKDLPLENPYLK